jgi:hypothetical protein
VDELQRIRTGTVVRENEPEGDLLQLGRWYWVKPTEDAKKPWLGCTTHVGTNFIKLEGVEWHQRVHLDEMHDLLTYEPNPEQFLNREVETRQMKVNGLMKQIQDITARLGVGTTLALTEGHEAEAISVSSGARPVEEYKQALIKAEKEDLPKLFQEVKNVNEDMARWMTAPLIPLKAMAKSMDPIVKQIKNRIFNVELYAGLTEKVKEVREGEPAPIGEKIHLFQRRAYMDEECLANYRHGGMDFDHLEDFDNWLCEPDNFTRLLPFPKTVLSFQIRRKSKDYEFRTFRDYVSFHLSGRAEWDKLTFLYIRNGERLYRLSTSIEFGHQLFPELEKDQFEGKTYARMDKYSRGKVAEMITEGHYEDIKARWEKTAKNDRWHRDEMNPEFFHPYTQASVYYDEITEYVKDQIESHNRIVLVLQGLLDRSPVFHPHPQWKIWNHDGFHAALELHYDDSRAISPGDKPDFEAYRRRLNLFLTEGSITVGQDDFWAEKMAEEENERRERQDSRRRGYSDGHDLKRYRPSHNPGPGVIATVQRVSRGKCVYEWRKKRMKEAKYYQDADAPVYDTIAVPKEHVLNVSEYKPGDFKQFFNDPRTREEYLQWAPLLLEAEEYHAGNRHPKPKDSPFEESSYTSIMSFSDDQQRARYFPKLRK